MLEQTVSSQKALIDQHGHGISVRNSLINDNSTTSSLSSMDIADKHTTKTSHSDVLKIPKVSAKQQALSRQFSNNEPNIPNTFMAHDSKADNSKNVPSINQSNSSRTQNKSPSSVFKPDQCIIISINKVYATTHNFNQDRIHKEINHAYGPMIIERITPYKYISDFPKVCLQLSRSETAKHVASAWKSDLFGGSSARTTIKYDAIKPTTMMCMLCMPLSTDDINIMKDIERVYNNISAKRLYKNGKQLHTMLLTFASEKEQSRALEEGIHLISSGVLCHCEILIQ